MMKCDAPKRGRGALSAHKGAAFIFTHQLRVFTGELCAHTIARSDDQAGCHKAGSRRAFGAHGRDISFQSSAPRFHWGVARAYKYKLR